MSVTSQSGPPPRGGDADFDFPALGVALWRSKWKILGPTLLVALVTLGIVQVITPRYQSESRILIESRDNVFLRPEADKDLTDSGTIDDETVTSQVQLVLSRDLARAVIAKLDLQKNPEFNPALNGISPIKAVLGRLGLIRDPSRMTPEERVLEAYYDRLTVYAIDKSHVIVVDFLSQNPEVAAKVANTIADEYLTRQRAAKQEQARLAVQFYSGEISTLQKRVADAEAKVAAYTANTNLLQGPNNTTLSAQQLGDINAQVAAARAQEADAEAKAKIIRQMLNSGQPIESSDILNSELIRRLSEQRITLRAELAEQSISLGALHPRIKELKAQIADLDQQIRAEAESIARSFESDAKIASARVDSLTAAFDQIKTQAATSNERDVELRALQRDAKAQRDLLESYLAKYREAAARDTVDSLPADARIISQATASNIPTYPKKLPSVLIATVATLMLCCGFVLTRELLTAPGAALRPVRQPRRAEPAAPMVPSGPLAPAAQPVVMPSGEAIADLAQSLRRDGAHRIAVVHAALNRDSGETAIRLARLLVKHGRVILVGLEGGAVGGMSDASAGMAEFAAGTASFGEVIAKDPLSGIHVISAGRKPMARAALLSSPRLPPCFDALARSYDYLIVDAGQAEGEDMKAIGEAAPRAILVTDMRAKAADAARERLLTAGFDGVTLLDDDRARVSATEAVAA